MALARSIAATPAVRHLPVQLTFQLLTGHAPARRPANARAPYWMHVDLADLGGQLRPRNHAVRVQLSADATGNGPGSATTTRCSPTSGVSGPTRAQSTRQDALATAAHAVARHCSRLLGEATCHPRTDVRAAREVVRWLELLDLL